MLGQEPDLILGRLRPQPSLGMMQAIAGNLTWTKAPRSQLLLLFRISTVAFGADSFFDSLTDVLATLADALA